ncbi:preprotein translocase subunit SecG [Candidatus Uhrbacteria bacterium RIFCSPLOWO2_12_FULL_46_10]|uniref:Protein-export membrane protein SecG n=1 Tax=Candidatus Uhrbacteria bacterium RIFCSPLOWO2_01_FULL_47_25 TaxID=1802402 RepID=A0A1F7UZK1_9BACT|nr:MAG: preprotein translocase subunit SecG [Candidatus Uhrbacteria bacterium RIFCSPHIGHO2_01_FULL_46_23]OGL69739.1 MAG: preprotein translocase subunit SecG [Candidatus Uhrbacteria bacterium RIFCSPHIGHO2_02_FULL_47_29]OGL76569.1 MAG: preprotein translocase subunit SecG [Candidatus Uhrbacteria bacterium RIFCSPHIGHO2_12_FULL_46_13]OGL83194.1 MAG: preprotein translocase subunit SecG [Candidatus Uhrbacteria bacterium RIFCSPLOWO2_01_FULL_47_25]OGL85853.1 MAG: preprotein translocase subunit SecG [Can
MISRIIILLPAIQAALSVLLILTILPQSRGTAVGAAFGGAGTIYRTKRGMEKWLMRATIVIGIIFTAVSLLRIILAS